MDGGQVEKVPGREEASPEAPGDDEKADEVKLRGSKDEVEKDEERQHEKEARILDACRSGDVAELKRLAESEGGLLSDALRRIAWPIMLGIPIGGPGAETGGNADAESRETRSWRELPRHKDEEQVQLDVNRSFIFYPNHDSDAELERRKVELSDLIVEVLRRHPFLCYFQGYHDICQVFLLVLDPPWRARLVGRLSLLRIRDFMLPTLAATVQQLRLIPDLVGAADATLRRRLGRVEPFYALGGTLTMYAHVIEEYGAVARLFDVLLARDPAFTLYLYAAIVLSRRDELLEFIDGTEDDGDDDPTMLQFVLSKVPRSLDMEALIGAASDLWDKHPPESLPSWGRVSRFSCLKTAAPAPGTGNSNNHSTWQQGGGATDRAVETEHQTVEEGRACFIAHAKELRRQERFDKLLAQAAAYRRPAQAAALAVAVGMLAVYLRKNPAPLNHVIAVIWRLSKGFTGGS